MRIPCSSSRPSAATNLTPLVDVVFLLIVFFLVSSHLARQESRWPVQLPSAGTFTLSDPDKAPLTINVDDQARLWVAGQVVGPAGLDRILADFVSHAPSQPAIRIRCDGRVPYRFTEPVLRSVAAAGIADVAIAVQQENP